MQLLLEVITPERELFSGHVDSVQARGAAGQMGILPHHAPLITVLAEGEMVARRGEEEIVFAIHGGYMQVLPDHVIVLADVAEASAEIDIARAEEARRRAEELLKKEPPPEERAAALGALRRSLVRLRVARSRRHVYRPEREQEG